MFKFLKNFVNKFTKTQLTFNEVILMAFASGEAAEEGTGVFPKYIGYTPVSVIGLNPNKAKIKELTGRELENEPEYTSKNKEGVNQVRLDFYLKTDATWQNKIDATFKLSFFLAEAFVSNKDKTKVEVIDNYGNTAWVTKEEFENKSLPSYTKKLCLPYRPCYQGERDLIKFIKTWLNIPDSHRYKLEQWVLIESPVKAEAYLTNIKALFKNDVKEISGYIAGAAEYKLKVSVGVKTTDQNKKYQEVFNREFIRNSSGSYDKLDKAIMEAKQGGAYANTEFSSIPLHELTVEATTFTPGGSEAPKTNPLLPSFLTAPIEPVVEPVSPVTALFDSTPEDTEYPEVIDSGDLPF